MGKYIHKFDTVSEFNDYRNENYKQPWLSYTSENDKMDYNEYSAEDYEMLNTPLTFEALEDSTEVVFYQSGIAEDEEQPVLEIEISTDDGNTWITKQAVQYNGAQFVFPTLILNAGEKVLIRGNNAAYGYNSVSEELVVSNGSFFADKSCYVYGNIMSLIGGNSFSTLNTVEDYAFPYLFSDYNDSLDSSWLLSHSSKKLLLPATTLANSCYNSMFYTCSNLAIAPELPATTLAYYCYQDMFHSCTSLTTAPKLPATTLTVGCYTSMFCDCTSLTIAPELPATILAEWCYQGMFQGCTGLTTAPELIATTLVKGCYSDMFASCTSLTTASELPAMTLTRNCYSSMFNNCTSLTTAPALPATTLADYCYSYMFRNCTSLVTAPELPATTLAEKCYNFMFGNCTNLIIAPTLPATTLVNSCYEYMFQGCSNLNYIKAMFTTTPSATYTSNWVNGVASTGTFVKNASASWTVTGASGVPTGWTVETASS